MMSDRPLRIAPGTETSPEHEEVILKDAGKRERKTRYRDRAPTGDSPTPAIVVRADAVVEHAPEPNVVEAHDEANEYPPLTWTNYVEWRKSKCPPYDYRLAKDVNDPEAGDPNWHYAVDEVNHAIHEFVGEVAELGQLFVENGPEAFAEPVRRKLIDECGDIFFCACWVMDAYGKNPIDDTDGIELLKFEGQTPLHQLAELISAQWSDSERGLHPRVAQVIEATYQRGMLEAQTLAGLLCDSYKKLRYQYRSQSVSKQISRIVGVMIIVNQFLVLAGSTVREALMANCHKLDTRYPNGFELGGGDRTGKGA